MVKAYACAFVDGFEAHRHPLADGLQRFDACASLGGVQPHASRRKMVDGNEDEEMLSGGQNGRGHVGSPHLID
ncbi:MAG: hypothetical protein ISN28_09145 [Ectothiorhodospiraceae bacterium AqS1]|nr:hypothetical protein [Ectothiorhodospiraceae bacterium AqS1]